MTAGRDAIAPVDAPRPDASPVEDRLVDEQAQLRSECFLLVAVATVLVVRTFLAATGYPQVGGRGLHIAHVLWGGLLMGSTIALGLILPGARVRMWCAVLGGIGFGLFIDEVGKFVTADVDYFFRPAVPIIYATFVVLQLTIWAVLRARPLDDARRVAIAASAITDLALGQLDRRSREQALRLVDGVDRAGPIAPLAAAVGDALRYPAATPRDGGRLATSWARSRRAIDAALASRWAQRTVIAVVAVQLLHVLVAFVVALWSRGGSSTARVVLDTGIASAVCVLLVVASALMWLTGHRRRSLTWLETAVLVQLLYTQMFIFERQQLAGLIGFVLGLFVLMTVRATRRSIGASTPV